MASFHGRLSAKPSTLFAVTAASQIPHPNRRPAKLRRNLCDTTKCAGRPVALRDLKKIQQHLTADALQPVKEVHFAAHALEPELPRIGG